MGLVLHLGEDEVPYPSRPKGRVSGPSPSPRNITTADVGEILEEKYNLYSVFFDVHGDAIANDLAEEMALALDAFIAGEIVDPIDKLGPKVEARFREFLDSYEAENVGIPGTPTQAALAGARTYEGVRSGPRRQSFIDSAALRRAFRAWIEEK